MKRGDSPTTEITNAAAGQPGYPAETESGETVFIISKERNDRTKDEKLTASDGRVFRPARLGEPFGLKPYDGTEGKDAEPVVEETPEEREERLRAEGGFPASNNPGAA